MARPAFPLPHGAEVSDYQICPPHTGTFGYVCCLDENGAPITHPETGAWMTYPFCQPEFAEDHSIDVIEPEDDPCEHPESVGCDRNRPYQADWKHVTEDEIASARRDLQIHADGVFIIGLERVLAHALAFIRDGWDLVRYCCCVYFGPNSDVCECLTDFFWDAGIDIVVTNDRHPTDPGASAWAFPGKSRIYLNASKVSERDVGPYFVDGISASGEKVSDEVIEQEQIKQALELAALLVHEALHICIDGDSGHDRSHAYDWLAEAAQHLQETCDLVDKVEDCFHRRATFRYYDPDLAVP